MEELLKTILAKLDSIEKEVRNLFEAIATNEAEHRNFETQLEQLYECNKKQQDDNIKILSWFAMISGILLTAINIVDKLFRR